MFSSLPSPLIFADVIAICGLTCIGYWFISLCLALPVTCPTDRPTLDSPPRHAARPITRDEKKTRQLDIDWTVRRK